MPIEDLLTLIDRAIEDLKGRDPVTLDVRGLSNVTDYMVVVTGTSNRHVKSIADEVALQAKQAGTAPLGVEGQAAADWVLVDLGEVVVHVMQTEARAFYDLERLWNPALQEA